MGDSQWLGLHMKTIGVVGAGQMGAGIAQVSAQAGYQVLLSDVDIDRATKGRDGIAKGLGRLVEKEKITADARDAALALIEPVAGASAFATADLVIEAATEREDIKRAIFAEIGKVLRSDALLASNTSSIPITAYPEGKPLRTAASPWSGLTCKMKRGPPKLKEADSWETTSGAPRIGS